MLAAVIFISRAASLSKAQPAPPATQPQAGLAGKSPAPLEVISTGRESADQRNLSQFKIDSLTLAPSNASPSRPSSRATPSPTFDGTPIHRLMPRPAPPPESYRIEFRATRTGDLIEFSNIKIVCATGAGFSNTLGPFDEFAAYVRAGGKEMLLTKFSFG
jgi:hypothetical protein